MNLVGVYESLYFVPPNQASDPDKVLLKPNTLSAGSGRGHKGTICDLRGAFVTFVFAFPQVGIQNIRL